MESPSLPWNAAHYPELEPGGGLAAALERALEPLWPGASVPRLEPPFLAMADVRAQGRMANLTLATGERRFLLELRSLGVAYGAGGTTSLPDVARAITLFVRDSASVAAVRAAAPWLKFSDLAVAHEAGPAAFVTHAWKTLSATLDKEPRASALRGLIPLVEACRARPRLRALLPLAAGDRLSFSRTTGYPYLTDCPTARHLGKTRFAVYGAPPSGHTLGEGDAAKVAEVIEQHLPPGCGPAVQGTAQDAVPGRRR
ncbi:MAG: DUF6193 family natural product biosynthesis protein [Myxococcota bacterium]|nr:DUF6193 family natural product biosynthesis protein [Myxococcota bacterium]